MTKKNKFKQSTIGRFVFFIPRKIRKIIIRFRQKREVKRILKSIDPAKAHIFNLGVCETTNMGDIAQSYCFEKWAEKNYPQYQIIPLKASLILSDGCCLLEGLDKYIEKGDLFFSQSGYNTNDFGSTQDAMRQRILLRYPDVPMIVLPQTVLFKTVEGKKLCSEVYNAHKKMIFFARDPVSFEYSKEMFPEIDVLLYPDIVTSLIGKMEFNNERSGICICRRHDTHEQLYSDEEFSLLADTLSVLDSITVTDTIIPGKNRKIIKDMEKSVNKIIAKFAKYRLVVTDKFHGTVFSLIAGTPVIILRTKDHKVISGYELFKKTFPDRIFLAETPKHVLAVAEKVLENPIYSKLDDYFDREYYQKLKSIIDNRLENMF